jgi:Ca-activated chloride channel family protein
MSQLRSSLHAVVENGQGAGARSVELRPGERLDRDFILRWALGDGAVRTSLVVAPDRDGQGASFALTVLPPEVGTEASGRATWCWCSIAPAAWAAGRWWRLGAPRPAWSIT